MEPARAIIVQAARHEFLARAGFAKEQHVGRSVGQVADLLAQGLHRRGGADQHRFDTRTLFELTAQVIAGAVVLYLAGAVMAFELSAVLGVFWLVLAGPVTCVAIVLVARVVLESLSAFMAMGQQVDELNELAVRASEAYVRLIRQAKG